MGLTVGDHGHWRFFTIFLCNIGVRNVTGDRKEVVRMMFRNSLKIGMLSILTLVFTLVGMVDHSFAEESAKEHETLTLGDVVVTAPKMETQVNKTPTNITVISKEAIQQYPGNATVFDLLSDIQVPGLYVPSIPNSLPVDGQLSTRGGEVSAWAVRFLVNGIEFNKGNGYIVPGRIPVHDIERIEIIKTPSAEYGDQAIGGVINLVTRTADKPLEAKAGIRAGGYGTEDYYAVINGRQDRWSYFLDAGFLNFKGYQHGAYEDDVNLYSRIAYQPDDASTITFHGSRYSSNANYANSLTLAQFEEDPRQNPGGDQPLDDNYYLGALVYDRSLGDADLSLKMEYKDEKTQMFWSGLWFEFDEWEAHPELTLSWHHNVGTMRNMISIGGEYRYHEIDTLLNMAPDNVIGTRIGDRNREDTSWAAYLQDELRITDALTLTAGLRYDYYQQEQVGNVNASNSWEQSNSAFSPKIGGSYSFSNAVNLFAGFNTGFKSPARVPAAATSGELDPEYIYAYEVGVRGNPLPWLDYNLAFFWHDVNDKFVKKSPDVGAPYENAGKTRSKGIEMGANASFENGLYAKLSYTYQEAKYVDYTVSGVSYDDNNIPNIPKNMFGGTLGYRHAWLGDISLHPVYEGKKYLNNANTLEWDGFWLLNAKYRKRFTDWNPEVEFFVTASNLTDEAEVTTGSGDPGEESLYPIAGRTIFAGLDISF